VFATLAMSGAVLLLRVSIVTLAPIAQLIAAVMCGAVIFALTALLVGGNAIHGDIQKLRRKQTNPAAEPGNWPFLPSASDENAPPKTVV
jgi:hypothetical protein